MMVNLNFMSVILKFLILKYHGKNILKVKIIYLTETKAKKTTIICGVRQNQLKRSVNK